MKIAGRLILTALAAYAAYAAFAMLCSPAFGQPAPPPPDPHAAQLRDLADFLDATLLGERDLAAKVQQYELEAKTAFPLYKPGTVLVAGGGYVVTGPIALTVNVDNVTLIGGDAPVTPSATSTAIAVAPGVSGTKILGVRGSWDQGPLGRAKLNIKPVIRIYGKNTRIIDCLGDRCDAFIELMAPCDAVVVQNCRTTGELRAAACYMGGARNVTLIDDDFPDSATENTVRASPENNVTPANVAVIRCRFGNMAAGKAACELRSVAGAFLWQSTFNAPTQHDGVGIGRADPNGGPWATDVTVRDCLFSGGCSVGINAGAGRITLENNRANWPAAGTNGFITVDGRAATIDGLRIVNTQGTSPVAQKPIVSYLGREKIKNLVDEGNGWTVGPATQPVGPN